MKHFIAYHSTEGMGYELHFDSDYRFHTSNPETVLKRSIGERLWIITGTYEHGRTKTFRLLAYYTPTKVEPSDRKGFDFQIVGRKGKEFSNPPVLNEREWFKELKKSLGNFSFGVREIHSQDATSGLRSLEKSLS